MEDKKPSEAQEGFNLSPYEPFNCKKKPRRIYLYRVPHNHGAQYPILEYVVERREGIPISDIGRQVQSVLSEIDNGLRPTGRDHNHFTWEKQSYLVFIYDGELERNNAITFIFDGDMGNHSFKDGDDLSGLQKGLTGFYCINYIRSRSKIADPDELYFEHFKFVVNHHGMFAHEGAGTNQGPPAGPPFANEDPPH